MKIRNEKTAGNIEDKLCDELTGIYNRTGFYKATELMFHKNQDTQFVIIYWNIRKFKVINELFGRDVGDSILLDIANKIKAAFENIEGTYCRMERDNFVMCFPLELLQDESFVKNEEIIHVSEGTKYHFVSCFGLYKVEDKTLNIGTMVDRSRLAMESVNENYVNAHAFYNESMRDKMVMEQIMMNDCEQAIKDNQFVVYYQPICNAGDGSITSAEALVRWQHPDRGMISPGFFIPLFEKNGFISVLDRYVWDKVCKMLKERNDREERIVPVSVNVSRIDFYNQYLYEDIVAVVEQYGINPELLRLEITESAYSDNPQCVLELVEKLQGYGFTIYMDDFGSGYSSLNTLKDLPVDILKIDMKFMNDLKNGEKSSIILESIIRMAKRMKLKVVAEGVEREEELNFLRNVECDYIQGYYFYKPMPKIEFKKLLNNTESTKADIIS